MIGWSDINPVLVSLFSTVGKNLALEVEPVNGTGGTRAFSAEWRERSRSAIHDVQRLAIFLKVTSVVGLGTDEVVYEYVDPSSTDPDDAPYLGSQRAVTLGQRKFNLQVTCVVPEHTDEFWAMAATERIRTAMQRPSTIEALDAVEVAVIEIKQALKTSFKDNGRVVSCAVMDIAFGTVGNDIDPIPAGWIEAITYTSHISDVDGLELPTSLQVTNLLVPDDFVIPVGDGNAQVNLGSGNVQVNTGSGNVQVNV